MALAFCYTNWRVASTIIGVTTLAQLDEDLDAWGITLPPALLAQIDAIRWTDRDPAQRSRRADEQSWVRDGEEGPARQRNTGDADAAAKRRELHRARLRPCGHGGTEESAKQLGVDEHAVVKTLVIQDEKAQPLIVLMHGDKQVSTNNLARQIGAKSVEPCRPEGRERAFARAETRIWRRRWDSNPRTGFPVVSFQD